MPVSKRRNRSLVVLISLAATAIFLLPASQAEALEFPNACVNNILPGEASSIPIVMTAKTSTAGPVNAGDSITLENIEQEAKIPSTVFVSGYNVGVLHTGVNQIPTEAETFIRGTNTVQETQATNKVLGEAETTITDPDGEPGTGDETATPGKLNVTYNNQTWTAGASGPINFREKTVFVPPGGVPGFSISKAGILLTALVPGGITARFGCDPGNVVEKAPPSTIEINTAPALASVAVNNAANRAPTANAGLDQNVASKVAKVTLNGFESTDGSEESFALKYNWTQTSGPSVTLTGATTPGASFAAPTGPATLTFLLEVCDNGSPALCNTDSVTVNVKSPPTANAGPDQTVESGTSSVTLDGSGSSDPNGETLTYEWKQTAGPSVTLSSTTVEKPTFAAPTGPATLEFELKVCESVAKTSCATDKVVINVRQPNVAPVANAGTDQTVASEATVTLDGSGSTDANTEAPLNTLSYEWKQLNGPSVTLEGASTAKPSFKAPKGPATLEFELKVCDGGSPSLCSTDTVKVTVEEEEEVNEAPVANAGTDQTVASEATVTLDGSGSTDPNGDPLSYEWTQLSGPSVTLSSATAQKPTFKAPTGPATLEFKLEVCDNGTPSLCSSDEVKVTVKSPPTANAGPDQTVESGTNPVTLDGSGSTDPNGETLTYKWSQTAGPSVTLSSTTVQKPTFTAPTGPATLEFSLEVCEEKATTSCSTDTVVIHVRQPNVAPVANAGPDQTVASEATVTLDGSGSTDANTEAPLNTLSYEWKQLNGPSVTLEGASTAKPTFKAPKGPASLEFELEVCDNGTPSLCSTDTVKVTVEEEEEVNEAPVANAGTDQTVASEATVTLDGSGSTDPNNDPLSYEWKQLNGPSVTLEGASTAKPTFKAPKGPASLEFELEVCDNGTPSLCSTDTVKVTVEEEEEVNEAPVANAGTDQTVASEATVTLDGSGSTDPNNDPLSYEWKQLNGPSVTLEGASTAKPSFKAPKGPASLEFELEVCDNGTPSLCSTDTVKVTVEEEEEVNEAPVANAGTDQTVASEATVTLDGSGSTDPNNDPLSYEWKQLNGPSVTLEGASTAKPTFKAPKGPASLEFELEVCDNGTPSLCSTDTVKVTVEEEEEVNEAPVANAGTDQTVASEATVTLDGSGSTDPNNDPLSYEWKQLNGPSVTLEGASTAKPTFKAPKGPASLEFELEVCDNGTPSLCSTDTVKVTVEEEEEVNEAPVANAGTDQTVASEATVTLDGSGSTDPNNDPLSYEWKQLNGPSVTLEGASTAKPTFKAPKGPASLEFELEVCDNGTPSLCSTDTVKVTVEEEEEVNEAPVANAGTDQTVASEATVTLDGSGSTDPNNDPLSYEWKQLNGPSVTLEGASTAKPTFKAPKGPATLEFELEVCDNGTPSLCSTDTVKVTVEEEEEVNEAPVANAGTDQTVASEATVTLDGSGSTDPNNDPLSYEWKQLNGPSVTLEGASTAKPTFKAPKGPASLEFELEVCDNGTPSLCSTDTVKVTVEEEEEVNEAPVANAGTDQTVASEATVTLDGSGSTDPNNDPLSYEWKQLNGPSVTLEGASTAKPTFKAPKGPASLEFELEVCDNGTPSLCSTDTVKVTVEEEEEVNEAPVANAGTDQTVASEATVTLDGSGSTDPNNDPLSYEWKQLNGPSVTLEGASTAKPTFKAPKGPASLEFELEVCDNGTPSLCSTDTVKVTVEEEEEVNEAPVANAGTDQTVASEATVTLDGSGSTDPNNDPLSYEWKQLNGPSVTLEGASTAKPTFKAPKGPASLEFELEVCDNGTPSLCSTDTVKVTVEEEEEVNEAPVANAGTDQTVASEATVTLDGSGSTDPNNDPLSYEWKQLNGPSVTLEGASTAKPTFKAPKGPASLEFELEVCDNGTPSLCSTDTVKVTVNAPEAVVDASVEAIVNGKVSAKKTSKSISAQIRNLGTGTLTVCASDVSWTVTVNGSPTGSVSPKEGCKTLSPGAKTKFTYTWNYGAGTVKAGDTVKFTATVTVSGDSISGNNSDSVTVKASK